MKAIIVSDTHGRNDNYFKVIEMHKPDLIIHCGDLEGGEYAISAAAKCPVEMVSGNNDFFSDLPRESEISFCGRKIWITHGHHYYLSMGTEIIKEEARSRGVDIVCFGHTHKPVVEYGGGVVAVNPGSLSYPRQDGRQPSYIIMETDRFKEIHFTIAYLK